jgi:hypothetical protein
MKKMSLLVLVSLSALASAAYSHSVSAGVRESTDPAKIADIEQRAQALQAQQESLPVSRAVPARKYHPGAKHHRKPAPAAGSAQ